MEFSDLLNPVQVIVQILNFLAVFFILRALFWRKFLGLLDARKAEVAADYEKAAQAKAETERLKTEYQDKIASIQDAGRAKLQEIVVEAERLAQGVRHKAQDDANRIIENARRDIQYELSRAKTELKEEVVNLAVSLTEHALEDTLTEEEDQRLTKNFLDKLDKIDT